MPIEVIVKTLFIMIVIVGALAPVITWVERKQSAVMQDRIGANRANIGGVRILGLLHPAADVLKLLSKEELAGVMAHELAHIKNRDTLIMTISATIAGAIGFLAQFALFFRGNRGAGGLIGALAVMILAPIAASLVQMTISRTREYAADRMGAEICENPLWLASALRKIAGYAGRIEMPSAERNPASAHLFIMNPLIGKGADKLFSTHPNPENRIAALEEMAGREMRSRRPAVRGRNPWR